MLQEYVRKHSLRHEILTQVPSAQGITDTLKVVGAWAQLLTLFRLIHDGGRHGGMKLLARKGYLFDPDRYPFLEGRLKGS